MVGATFGNAKAVGKFLEARFGELFAKESNFLELVGQAVEQALLAQGCNGVELLFRGLDGLVDVGGNAVALAVGNSYMLVGVIDDLLKRKRKENEKIGKM